MNWWHYKIIPFWQRGSRGYANSDLWNLNDYIAAWLPVALRQLKREGWTCLPGKTPEEWYRILECMAQGFEAWAELNDGVIASGDNELIARLEDKQAEGFELFAKWFGALWD